MTATEHAPTRTAEKGVLHGLKVVELTHLIAGPYCGMLLADEGAEVIKIEPPIGEQSRAREPIRSSDQGTVSGYYGSLNRRKKSVVLDLKTSAGTQVFERVLAEADVFVTNMRAQALGRLGIHPVALRERFPSLIIANISGFGLFDSGPDEDRAGLAMVAEALSGSTGLTRDRSGSPVWCGFALGDVAAAMTAHSSILLALRRRDETGEGRLIDLALPECTLPFMTVALARIQSADQEATEAAGSNNFHGVPYGVFPARDGYFNIGVNRDELWVRLCRAMGRPELGRDERYATYLERARRKHEVHELVESWSRELGRDEAVELITKADVPVAPVLSMPEVFELEHFHRRGIYIEVDDGIGGTFVQPTDPTGFAVTEPARISRLGEDRDGVLRERFGLSADEVQELARNGAFGPIEASEEKRPATGGV
ncbi:CoA transferase [Saccharomonospora sp. NPDC046836]|uniref:CaiB/BaiF CoA transferase family protein n=1 Tax=Saccharomonospora sp. NPDC046836 TaxID=3156921 RepID=UPI0034076FF4